jgi:polar amino acid transport system substrate-binding protein
MKTSFLLLSFLLFACTPSPEKEDTSTSQEITENTEITMPVNSEPALEQCELILGFDAWEPYQYLDVGGVVTGLDIELVTGVAQQIGCEVSYQQGTWVDLLAALQRGEVDMLLGASKTEAREEFAFFSDPYRMEEFSLYIRKGDSSAQSYQTITEFIENEASIGIVSDYVYGPEVAGLLDSPEQSKGFVNAIMGELNVARLLDEDIDGFLEDSFVGASLLRRKALSELIVEHEIKIQTGNAYVMFSQQGITPEQLSMFNTELQKVKDSQVYTDLISKYAM